MRWNILTKLSKERLSDCVQVSLFQLLQAVTQAVRVQNSFLHPSPRSSWSLHHNLKVLSWLERWLSGQSVWHVSLCPLVQIPRIHVKTGVVATVVRWEVQTGESPETLGPACLAYAGMNKRPCFKVEGKDR